MSAAPFITFAAGTIFLLVAAPACKAQEQPARQSPALQAPGHPAIDRKLAKIIIPRIEFHSTSLEDAIEFLRQESRQLDTDPDLNARGINILLPLPPPASQTSQPQATNTRITLTLNRIPLLEALQYVALQAGLKVRIEPYAVSLVPLSENTDAMVTAVLSVPPDFMGNATTGGNNTSALDQPASACSVFRSPPKTPSRNNTSALDQPASASR